MTAPLLTRLLTRSPSGLVNPPPPTAGPRPSTAPRLVRPHSVPVTARSVHAPSLVLRTTPAWHLARRAAQAPTAAVAADIQRLGVRRWLDAQLAPAGIADTAWDAIAAKHFPWLPWTSKQVTDHRNGAGYEGGPVLAHALAVRPIFTQRVLWESVVEVWGDLLYVPYLSKANYYVLEFDRVVLRRHAFGRYADLLHAAVTHPAVLNNLDNDVSSKDNPNENLGREILELYSVGVGAYTETDVRQSTLLLTGHEIDWTNKVYRYNPWMHHIGPLRVMGFSHPNANASDGPVALRAYTDYLARHPRTAQRVARRLATRFVSDSPSEALVQTLAQTYLAADTAIVPVLRRLFDHPEFWASVGAKWSRPAELGARAVRSARPTGWMPAASIETNPWAMSGYFWSLWSAGHAPRNWPRVDGYPDTARAWRSSTTTLAGWNIAHAFAWGWGDGPTYPLQVNQTAGETDTRPRWDLALGVTVGDDVLTTARRITRDLTGYTWAETDVAPVASWLASWGERPATATDRMTADGLLWALPEAARLVLASPYSFLR